VLSILTAPGGEHEPDLSSQVGGAPRRLVFGNHGSVEGTGDLERARQAAADGGPVEMVDLGRLLKANGDLDEAEEWYRRAAEAGSTTAMFNLGHLFENDRDDPIGAETWYRRGAEAGNAMAMNGLGVCLNNQGDVGAAEAWYRRAAETGNIDAMKNLGILFDEAGDVSGSESWYRRAAEAGNRESMTYIGYLLKVRGDVDGAEEWFLRAAEVGDTGAANNLGVIHMERGDLDGAQAWYRKAAEAGDTSAMINLGYMLRDGSDLDGAEVWYRQALEAGNARALDNLGYLFAQRGDRTESEVWYRQAADAGSSYAMNALGSSRRDVSDFEGAEAWYRQAAEAGDATAMNNLGNLLRNMADLDGADAWYRRALEAGHPDATDGLAVLGRKIDHSDRQLESISFDTFGWKMTQNGDGFREWRSHELFLVERFMDAPPDLPSWDADEIREGMSDTFNLIGDPDFRIEDAGPSDEYQKYFPAELPEQPTILDVTLFEIPPAKCVAMTFRYRSHSEIRYSLGMLLLFAECVWMLTLVATEDSRFVGEREGAAAHRILEDSSAAEIPTDEFDPYDRRWDGLVPIEHDPLTRLRLLSGRLRDSIKLDSRLSTLTRFAELDD